MAVPKKLLTEGETAVVELRPTWLVLGWPLVATIAAAVLAIAVVVALQNPPAALGYFLLALVLLTGGWLGIRWLRWHATSIVLTNTRLLERTGVLSRTGIEVRLDRINELSYRQTLLERVVRTGTLVVEVGGETGVVEFDHLPQPASVQSLVTEQIETMRRARYQWMGPAGMVPTAPPPAGYAAERSTGPSPSQGQGGSTGHYGGPTVAERLVQLDELRQRGILSDSEFQAKKVELLRQL